MSGPSRTPGLVIEVLERCGPDAPRVGGAYANLEDELARRVGARVVAVPGHREVQEAVERDINKVDADVAALKPQAASPRRRSPRPSRSSIRSTSRSRCSSTPNPDGMLTEWHDVENPEVVRLSYANKADAWITRDEFWRPVYRDLDDRDRDYWQKHGYANKWPKRLRRGRAMRRRDEGKAGNVGPEYLNEALREARVKDIEMSLDRRGRLHMDTDLKSDEIINRLISGIAWLYGQLRRARRGDPPLEETTRTT